MSCGKSQWAEWQKRCISGVVSLPDMLEFAAKDFFEISHKFGLVLGEAKHPTQSNPDILGSSFGSLLVNCADLGLNVTVKQMLALMTELANECPESVIETKERGVEIKGATLKPERLVYHLEALYSTLLAEIASHTFKAIPQEKIKYCDPLWLTKTPLFTKFPDIVDEFQRAGRCFAYGENTASIFHLMRVTDFCFRKVAESLNASYDPRNWQEIGHKITKNMEQKYQTKTDDWKQKEPFYAEILTDIQALGRGHRNPALHELEKKYDEREAIYMLTVIEKFAEHVAKKL